MQTYKQFLLIFSSFLFLCSVSVYSQDIPPKKEVNLPAGNSKDTLSVSLDSIMSIPAGMELNEIVNDTIKTDSIKPEKESLTDVVDYFGEDYVYMNRVNKKVYMYNKAYIVYEDMRIDAGLIILDYSKNEIFAKGIDSLGEYTQKPVFVQSENKVEPDSIRFNFDTEKALIYNSRTEQNGINVLSEIAKKENDSVVFLRNVKFTTSTNIEDPEYYFYTRRAKVVPQRKIVTGLTNMYIADVPLPIGLPFGFFPLSENRTSGFLLPTIGDNNNRGFFFQNGGYYFAINDYLDLTLLGDYYTNGSYALRSEISYALRYKFRGNLSLRFEKLLNSERGFPDFSESSVYNIRWNHNQDSKVNPSSRFSASVNLGSSRFFQESINQINNASSLINTLSSSVSYSKSFDGDPQVNVSLAATHTQNTNTKIINMSLPNMTVYVTRVFPFAPKSGTKKGIIQNINLQYNLSAQNKIQTVDSLFFKSGMFDNAQIGARHSIPISTNFKILNYLSASASTSFQETWVLKTTRKSYVNTANNGNGAVVTDTIPGFDSYRTYNFSSSLGTTIYGTFNFGKDKKIQAIRHVLRPSLSYNISPSFDQFYDEYLIPSTDPNVIDDVVEYSRFENTLFGAPGKRYSSNLGISISNTFEAKVKDKDTTATDPKKVILLNNLNFSTAYNLAGDSLQWSPVRITGSIPIVKKLDINFNGTLDPYALDNSNNRIDKFNIDNGGSLFRLTNGNVSINYTFSSKDLEGKKEEYDPLYDETFRNGGRPDDLFGDSRNINDLSRFKDNDQSKTDYSWYNYAMPWDLRIAYTMTYSNSQRQNEISSQSLMFSSNIELSPKWSVGISSGYDFKNKGVTLTQLRFQRDLESWKMNFSWTPIGSVNTAWYFFIGIKSSILSDIKYDQRREADRRL